MSKFKPIRCLESSIPEEISDGALYITTDTEQLFVDTDSKRLAIKDVITVEDEASLPLAPVKGKLYVALSEKSLWAFTTEWVQIGSGSGGGGYVLPVASKDTLGGVKIDDVTIKIDENGVISIADDTFAKLKENNVFTGTNTFNTLKTSRTSGRIFEAANGASILAHGSNANAVHVGDNSLNLALKYNQSFTINNTDVRFLSNTPNTSNAVVQLDESGKLPAIDGSQLTNLPNSNSYTKDEINVLLSNKQDTLTPSAPLSITKEVRSNLEGFSYTTDSTGIYTNDSNVYYFGESKSIYVHGKDNLVGGTNDNTVFQNCVRVPYKLNQWLKLPVITEYSRGHIAFLGKYTSEGIFEPIFIPKAIGGSTWYVILDNNCNITSYGNGYVNITWLNTHEFSYTTAYRTDNADTYGLLNLKLSEDESSIIISTTEGLSGYNYKSGTVVDANAINRLKEINCALIVASSASQNASSYNAYIGTTSTNAIAVSNIGVYNADIDLSTLDISTDIASLDLGENTFDLSGEQAYNYLDLNIDTSNLKINENNQLSVNTDSFATSEDLADKLDITKCTDIPVGLEHSISDGVLSVQTGYVKSAKGQLEVTEPLTTADISNVQTGADNGVILGSVTTQRTLEISEKTGKYLFFAGTEANQQNKMVENNKGSWIFASSSQGKNSTTCPYYGFIFNEEQPAGKYSVTINIISGWINIYLAKGTIGNLTNLNTDKSSAGIKTFDFEVSEPFSTIYVYYGNYYNEQVAYDCKITQTVSATEFSTYLCVKDGTQSIKLLNDVSQLSTYTDYAKIGKVTYDTTLANPVGYPTEDLAEQYLAGKLDTTQISENLISLNDRLTESIETVTTLEETVSTISDTVDSMSIQIPEIVDTLEDKQNKLKVNAPLTLTEGISTDVSKIIVNENGTFKIGLDGPKFNFVNYNVQVSLSNDRQSIYMPTTQTANGVIDWSRLVCFIADNLRNDNVYKTKKTVAQGDGACIVIGKRTGDNFKPYLYMANYNPSGAVSPFSGVGELAPDVDLSPTTMSGGVLGTQFTSGTNGNGTWGSTPVATTEEASVQLTRDTSGYVKITMKMGDNTASYTSASYLYDTFDANCVLFGCDADTEISLNLVGVFDSTGTSPIWQPSTKALKLADGLALNIGNGLNIQDDILVCDVNTDEFATKKELEEKQDKIYQSSPITIQSVTTSNLTGYSYTSDGTGFYSTKNATISTANWFSIGNGIITQSTNSYFDTSSAYGPNSWAGGYLDIPYKFGQVLKVPTEGAVYNNFIAGKYVDGGAFVPIMDINYSHGGKTLNISDNLTLTTSGSTQQLTVPAISDYKQYTVSTSGGRANSMWLIQDKPYHYIQWYIESDGTITQLFRDSGTSDVRCYRATSANITTELLARWKEVTVVRVPPIYVYRGSTVGQSTSNAYKNENFGLYPATKPIYEYLTEQELIDTGNKLEFGGSITQTYIGLNIGESLKVSDGKLETSLDTSTLATKTDLTKKQDKLVAGDGIEIKTVYPSQETNEYFGYNTETSAWDIPIVDPTSVNATASDSKVWQVIKGLNTTKAFEIEFSVPYKDDNTYFWGLGLNDKYSNSSGKIYLSMNILGYRKLSDTSLEVALCYNTSNKRLTKTVNFTTKPSRVYFKYIRPDAGTAVQQVYYKLDFSAEWIGLGTYSSAENFINNADCSMYIGAANSSVTATDYDITDFHFQYLPASSTYLEISAVQSQNAPVVPEFYNADYMYKKDAVVFGFAGTETIYFYKSLQSGNIGHALDETDWWLKLKTGGSSTALNTGSLAGVVYGPVETTNPVTTTVSVKEVTE